MTDREQEIQHLQHMAAIIEYSDDAIISKTLEGIITSWNPAAERMYGYSSQEIVGEPIQLIIPADRPHEMNNILADVRQDWAPKHYETVRVRKDGTKIPVSLTVSPIHNENGAVVGLSSIARDVTTQLAAFQSALEDADAERMRVEQVNAELQVVNEAIRSLTSVAAHDLRSPLTAIVGFSELLCENWDAYSEVNRREMVEAIDRHSRNLSALVDDLLTSSSIDSGAMRISPELIALRDAIDRRLEMGSWDKAGVTVSCSPDLVVSVDPQHLARILDNYVHNAFKYGQPPVRIEVAPMGDLVEIRVLDRGPGVPSEFVSRLFDKFARADTQATRAQSGTGLGLSIVRGLAEVNGGQALYRPNVPHGSCFIVLLPAGP